MEDNATTLLLLPLFHIGGLNIIMSHGLRHGATQIIMPSFDPGMFLEILTKHRPNTMLLVPPLIQFLAQHPAVTDNHLASINNITGGAAPIGLALLDQMHKKAPHIRWKVWKDGKIRFPTGSARRMVWQSLLVGWVPKLHKHFNLSPFPIVYHRKLRNLAPTLMNFLQFILCSLVAFYFKPHHSLSKLTITRGSGQTGGSSGQLVPNTSLKVGIACVQLVGHCTKD